VCLYGYPRETIGYTFYHPVEGKTFVAKVGTFLEKEFLARGVSGKKVELDKIVDPSLKIPSSTTEDVSGPFSMEDEGEDNDEIARKTKRRSACIRKSPEWFGNPMLTVMLVELDEPTTYTEAM
jgi:hypothetical protein